MARGTLQNIERTQGEGDNFRAHPSPTEPSQACRHDNKVLGQALPQGMMPKSALGRRLLALSTNRGYCEGNKVYVRHVMRSRNYFRIYEGYGFDQSILEKMMDAGVIYIIIKEEDTGRVLVSDRHQWTTCSEFYKGSHGPQIVLREYLMTAVSA